MKIHEWNADDFQTNNPRNNEKRSGAERFDRGRFFLFSIDLSIQVGWASFSSDLVLPFSTATAATSIIVHVLGSYFLLFRFSYFQLLTVSFHCLDSKQMEKELRVDF